MITKPEAVRAWKERSARKYLAKRRDKVATPRARKTINKKGRQGKANDKVNGFLHAAFEATDIRRCEIGGAKCLGKSFLTYAHLYKRRNMLERGTEITPKQCVAVLACVHCHNEVESLGEEKMRGALEEVIRNRHPIDNAVLVEVILKKGIDIAPLLDKLTAL